MAVTPTYPGVYIEEVPSGVRTIAGVATSIAAFVGYFPRGPINVPLRVFNMGDVERELGGLARRDEAGYAIQQFFLNGGQQAWVVRVAAGDHAAAAVTLRTADDEPVLRVSAGRRIDRDSVDDPGTWGENLRIDVDYATSDPSDDTRFNLTVTEIRREDDREVVVGTEEYTGVSIDPDSPSYVVDKVNGASALVQLEHESDSSDEPLEERPAQTGTTGAPASGTIDTDAELTITVGSVEHHVALGEHLEESADLSDDLAKVRRALERAIRAVGRDEDEPRLAGAAVTVQRTSDDDRVLRVVLGRGAEGFDPADIVELSGTTDDGDTVDRLGFGSDAIENVQLYALGGSDKGRQSDGVDGADGELPNTAALTGSYDDKTGLYALRDVDLFNLLCLPTAVREEVDTAAVYSEAIAFCEDERAFVLVDVPEDVSGFEDAFDWVDELNIRHRNAAVYYPRVRIPDPLNENRRRSVGASGTMAGVYARIDGARGVWKAPAGLEATLRNVAELDDKLTDAENGVLNPKGINVLRRFPVYGRVAWGARTLDGADVLASEWKYVPVRRTALYLQESLYRGLQWVVFEPNDDQLWGQIRLSVGAFMHNLFRKGAFQGTSPDEAYLVKCDSETTTQTDINQGIVNIVVGFAPLKPAEFVILKIRQLAGETGS